MGYVGFREGTSSQTSVSKTMVSLARGSVACSTCSTKVMSSAISVVNPWNGAISSGRLSPIGSMGRTVYLPTWLHGWLILMVKYGQCSYIPYMDPMGLEEKTPIPKRRDASWIYESLGCR